MDVPYATCPYATCAIPCFAEAKEPGWRYTCGAVDGQLSRGGGSPCLTHARLKLRPQIDPRITQRTTDEDDRKFAQNLIQFGVLR